MKRRWWTVFVYLPIALLCAGILLPCIQHVPDEGIRPRSSNCLKQILLALQNYHEVYGRLPPAIVRDKDGHPLYSWRVAILPFIEESSLWKQFHLDEPWDSPHNSALIETVPRAYNPSYSDYSPGMTRYQVLVGPGTPFEEGKVTFAEFTKDRRSNLLVVEAEEPVLWSKPCDLAFDPNGPLPRLYMRHLDTVDFLCLHLWQYDGALAGYADGSVRFLPATTDEQELRAMISRN